MISNNTQSLPILINKDSFKSNNRFKFSNNKLVETEVLSFKVRQKSIQIQKS
jgi:hypothetical protein